MDTETINVQILTAEVRCEGVVPGEQREPSQGMADSRLRKLFSNDNCKKIKSKTNLNAGITNYSVA